METPVDFRSYQCPLKAFRVSLSVLLVGLGFLSLFLGVADFLSGGGVALTAPQPTPVFAVGLHGAGNAG